MSMKRDLLSLLARKWVTPLVALNECNCLSLAQRVSEWRRADLPIVGKWVDTPTGKRVMAYRLIKPTKWTA